MGDRLPNSLSLFLCLWVMFKDVTSWSIFYIQRWLDPNLLSLTEANVTDSPITFNGYVTFPNVSFYNVLILWSFFCHVNTFFPSTVWQLLYNIWKAISLYEIHYVLLLLLLLLFTSTLGVIIEVNIFYINTNSVRRLFFHTHAWLTSRIKDWKSLF